MKKPRRNIRLVLLLLLIFKNIVGIAQLRDVIVHDPVMIKQDDTYYIFHTGKGISVKSSKDLKTWKEEKPVFATIPPWVLKSVPKFDGSVWLPMYFTPTVTITCIIPCRHLVATRLP